MHLCLSLSDALKVDLCIAHKMAPSHGPLSVGGFLYCGCRSMSDETGRK